MAPAAPPAPPTAPSAAAPPSWRRDPAAWYARRSHDRACGTFTAVWGIIVLHVLVAFPFISDFPTPTSDYDWLVGTDAVVKSSFALRRMQEAASEFVANPERSTLSPNQALNFVYEAREGAASALTPETLDEMLAVELALLNNTGYADVCVLAVNVNASEPFECTRPTPGGVDGGMPVAESVLSPLALFYDIATGRAATGGGGALETYTRVEAVRDAQGAPYAATAEGIRARLSAAFADPVAAHTYAPLFAGEGWAPQEGRLKPTWVQSMYFLGLPLAGYANPSDRDEEQREQGDAVLLDASATLLKRYGKKEGFGRSAFQGPAVKPLSEGGELKVIWWSMPQQENEWQGLSFKDLSWTVLCIICVFGYIAFHTKSVVLASVAMSEIIFSLLVALFWFRVVFQVTFFQFINFLIVFVVLGIGADDVFVFVDAYRQSSADLRARGKSALLVDRLEYTIKRASTAIFVTSLTTAAAFLATSISPLKPLQSFGIYSALVVLCVLWMNLLLMPPMLALYARNFEGRTLGEAARGFWLCGYGAAPYADPGLTLPSLTEASQVNGTSTAESEMPAAAEGDGENATKGDGVSLDPKSLRAIERFFYGPYSHFLRGPAKWVIIVAFLGLLVGGAVLWAQLEPPAEPEEWFPDNHMFQQYQDIISGKIFPQVSGSRQGLEVSVLWGYNSLDRSGISRWESSSLGKVIYDETFDPSSAEAQAYLMGLYAALRSAPCASDACTGGLLARSDEPILNIVAETHPASGNANVTGGMYHWLRLGGGGAQLSGAHPLAAPVTGARFHQLLCEYASLSEAQLRYPQLVGFSSGNCSDARTRFLLIQATATVRMPQPPQAFSEAQDEWRGWVEEQNGLAPLVMNGARATSSNMFWLWSVTSMSLVRAVYLGMAIVVPFVFVVLVLSTDNLLLALYSTLTILGIVTTVIGIGASGLQGWDLGTAEAIAAIIIIGFSVDYCVHIANAYMESGASTRWARMRIALTTMGISVTAGAITTIFAGVFLSLCILTFFVKFSFLIVWTIIVSFVWAVCFFPALCIALGPEGNQFDIKPLKRWVYARLSGFCSKPAKA